jgi:hypothetical protein
VQVKADFDWAHQISDILSQLHSVLSGTIAAWKLFNPPRGDIEDTGYFRGVSTNAQLSLCEIGLIFRQLEGDEKRLALLRSRCTEFSRAVSYIPILSTTHTLVIKETHTDSRDIAKTSLATRS